MANPTNGKSMERDGEEPLDPQGMSLAAALWSGITLARNLSLSERLLGEAGR